MGRRVAEALGSRIVDRNIFEEVLKKYGIVEFEELLDSAPGFWTRFDRRRQDMVDVLNKVYLGFAKKNNIIFISRRAYLVLDPFVNVLNVCLKAPEAARVQNVMAWRSIFQRDAVELVRKSEEIRVNFIEAFTKGHWDSLQPFSLVINTHRIGFELAQEWIVAAANRLGRYDQQTGWQDGIPTIETIEPDPIMEDVINQVFEA